MSAEIPVTMERRPVLLQVKLPALSVICEGDVDKERILGEVTIVDQGNQTIIMDPEILERAASAVARMRAKLSDLRYVCALHGYHEGYECGECKSATVKLVEVVDG